VKKNLFKPEQIAAILKQQELGTPVAEIGRKFGIAEHTFYRWKKQYGGLSSNPVIELSSSRRKTASSSDW
jgi:putative transposase